MHWMMNAVNVWPLVGPIVCQIVDIIASDVCFSPSIQLDTRCAGLAVCCQRIQICEDGPSTEACAPVAAACLRAHLLWRGPSTQ